MVNLNIEDVLRRMDRENYTRMCTGRLMTHISMYNILGYSIVCTLKAGGAYRMFDGLSKQLSILRDRIV